jgi:hypothetical protein
MTLSPMFPCFGLLGTNHVQFQTTYVVESNANYSSPIYGGLIWLNIFFNLKKYSLNL